MDLHISRYMPWSGIGFVTTQSNSSLTEHLQVAEVAVLHDLAALKVDTAAGHRLRDHPIREGSLPDTSRLYK